ncbi:hypothetical protein FDG2_3839 [Candidatus Protofrankia californiensis]|uniref:Uncharacterized protein n=1 Tax=Candidatus Protofrankia californiensis TaxID=1839754 RepID=A0A1C3P175_9ACTN|nr:hypothetical protein FDG2_3839 [Candidatus Protofrankia californiensis]
MNQMIILRERRSMTVTRYAQPPVRSQVAREDLPSGLPQIPA